jgi:ABC-type transport system involved in multi-copper enzyme maturation permease subunit
MNLIRVAGMTVKLLHRQQSFYALLVLGTVILAVAQLTGSLIPEESRRLVNETGSIGFLGVMVLAAAYWGARLFAAGKKGGSLEFQMTAPVTRSSWALGRFSGMAIALMILALVLIAEWQILLQISRQEWATSRELVAFEFNALNALLVAALAVLFSTLMRPMGAATMALGLWAVGMNTAVINYWNLQRLNPGARLSSDQIFSAEQLTSDTLYGLSMIVILVVCSCFIFSKRQ